ncbi:unnamed protein product, partial [marine sediment metagenome]
MSREAVETIEYKGHTIEIFPDDCGESPRDWDNITEIHYHANSYVLGDTNWYGKIDEYDAMLKQAKRQGDLVIPMFAYIHSGVHLSLESFYGKLPQGHAEFDSGRAGSVIVRRKEILDNWGAKRMSAALREKGYNAAKGDIDTLNQFFAGDVYGYVVDGDGDSCWGFYGTKDCIDEAEGIVDWIVKDTIKKHVKKVKQWIKGKVPLQYRTG